jgi:hypothetical protein
LRSRAHQSCARSRIRGEDRASGETWRELQNTRCGLTGAAASIARLSSVAHQSCTSSRSSRARCDRRAPAAILLRLQELQQRTSNSRQPALRSCSGDRFGALLGWDRWVATGVEGNCKTHDGRTSTSSARAASPRRRRAG